VQRNGPWTPAPCLIATVDTLKELHIHPLSLPRHPKAPATSPADPPTALEDCRKLCRCRVRLRALYLAFGLKPIVPVVTVCSSALLVKFVGALLNLLLNRDQDGRLVRLRCEYRWLWFQGGNTSLLASPEIVLSSVMAVTLSMFRRDVVAGSPFVIARHGIEVLLDKLFSPRQSVAPAHRGDYRRRNKSPTKQPPRRKEIQFSAACSHWTVFWVPVAGHLFS
jgi:hypothetical protein